MRSREHLNNPIISGPLGQSQFLAHASGTICDTALIHALVKGGQFPLLCECAIAAGRGLILGCNAAGFDLVSIYLTSPVRCRLKCGHGISHITGPQIVGPHP